MTTREYRMRKRADDADATRDRIVKAAFDLHFQQGVAATSYVQIAERAGVGAATVYRHFPTLGTLVTACGAAVWEEVQPPLPENAPRLFEGLVEGLPRLEKLTAELNAFYARAADWLAVGARDRDNIPELADFLRQVAAGIRALVREALGRSPSDEEVEFVAALADISLWRRLKALDPSGALYLDRMPRLLACAIRIASGTCD